VAKKLQTVLRRLLNISGVVAVGIISRDGFVIDYSSKIEIDLEAIGAVIASGFGSSEVMGSELVLGYLNQCILEYDTNKILMASINDYILAVLTEGNAVVGQIRYNIQKSTKDVAKFLS
jgi:predicted regulator of Ras-like GTPase activity (Roadblock/LC7/MglB family)